MKDKIIQITGVDGHVAVLTDLGRVLISIPGGWEDITPPKDVLNMDDGIPRFEFGKYKGEPIKDAKPKYLDWCRENIDDFNWKIVDGKLVEEKKRSPLVSYTDTDKPTENEKEPPF